ncbi:MAG: efflux RND transporter periplasmic adaptor subunit [Bacteroidetes bacterium]|nr:efflux RND transporter periplasmic adaptor subunit [Bacteroidota bacterium]
MKKIFMLLSACFALINSGCKSEHNNKEESTHFQVSVPVQKDTLITRDYVSQIRSINHIEIRALERGYLEQIFVDEGQVIKKGQMMFQILPIMYKAELQKAQAEANFAEIEYLNTKKLADSNVVSANELALAKAKYDKALAELAVAQVHLGFTEIKAPFDGIMDRFYVRLGSLVEDGDLLTTLSDNSQMWVYFNVPEAEYLDYKTSTHSDSAMKVELIMANNKMFDYKGVVQTIEADFNNETGNIAFRATFPNPERLLRHGETGKVRVKVPLDNAILIPQKATFEVLDKKFVYVIKNGVVESRHINVGNEMPHLYAVTEGLSIQDTILIEGLRKVKNGDKIETEFKSQDAIIDELIHIKAE